MNQCPCNSGSEFAHCCEPFIDGNPAPTALALMRSRFSAFALGKLDHIERTFAKAKRQEFNLPTSVESSGPVEWVGLKILNTGSGGREDDIGIVEFAALYKKDNRLRVHMERSNFCREDGEWVYVDGEVRTDETSSFLEKVGVKIYVPAALERNTKSVVAHDGEGVPGPGLLKPRWATMDVAGFQNIKGLTFAVLFGDRVGTGKNHRQGCCSKIQWFFA